VEVQPLLPDRGGGQDERAEGRVEGHAHIGAAGDLLDALAFLVAEAQGIAAANAAQLQRAAPIAALGDLIETQRRGA